MVKIKWLLISVAFIVAFAGAFASNEQLPCENLPQYFKWGNSYYPAGDYGTNYVCTNGPLQNDCVSIAELDSIPRGLVNIILTLIRLKYTIKWIGYGRNP
jgi:hypothetical protein